MRQLVDQGVRAFLRRFRGTPTAGPLAVAFALGAGGAACNRPATDAAAASDPLRVGVFTPITAPSPFEMDGVGSTVQELVFRSLLGEDEHGAPQGDLAEGWSFSPDGRVLSLRLREGLQFSDGAPLTARDAEATYRRARELEAWGMDEILAVDARSDRVLELRVAHPFVLPASLMTGVARAGTEPPIGAGPYRLESLDGERLVLAANPRYPGESARPERVEFVRYPSSSEPLSRLLAREIDLVPAVPWSKHELFRTIPSVRSVSALSKTLFVVELFRPAPPLDRPEVRLALSLAIDRRELVDGPMHGHARAANGLLWPGSAEHDASLPDLPYDPAEALRKLADAGIVPDAEGRLEYEGRPFRPVLQFFRGHAELEQVALLLERQLAEIGLALELRAVGLDEIVASRRRGEPAILLRARHAAFDLLRDPDALALDPAPPPEPASLEERHRLVRALERRMRDAPPSLYLLWLERLAVIDSSYCGLPRRPEGPEAALHLVHRCAPGENEAHDPTPATAIVPR